MPRLLELFCGTKSIGRAFEAAGWEVVSLDIVSKFEPTILCDIRSWDYALFPPGHFDMVWASPKRTRNCGLCESNHVASLLVCQCTLSGMGDVHWLKQQQNCFPPPPKYARNLFDRLQDLGWHVAQMLIGRNCVVHRLPYRVLKAGQEVV